MVDQSSALSLYMPKCALCFSDARTSSHYLVQLSCYHLYCNHCVQELQTAGQFRCPLDGLVSDTYQFNNLLYERTTWLTSVWNQLNETQVQGQINWLKNSVNFYQVFCRFQGCSGSMHSVPCPYTHGMNSLQTIPCPTGATCWRRATCPYFHQGGSGSNPAQAVPSDWYYSTVQVEAYMQKGHITIRSQSALNYLTENRYAQLHAIFRTVLGQTPQYDVKTHPVDFRSVISWMYLPQNGQVQEFSSVTSNQLEQTYRLKGSVITVDEYSCVYLNPMIRLYQSGGYEPVTRIERLNSTSDAAIIEVTCDSQYFSNLFNAVKAVEAEEPLDQVVHGDILKTICLQYGLSTRNNTLIGTRSNLDLARTDLRTHATPAFASILCMDTPASYPLQLVSYLCSYFGLLIAGNRIYGQTSEVQTFYTYLTSEYSSVPIPAGMSAAEVQALCVQHGLMTDGTYIAGPREAVRNVSSWQTYQATVPSDVEPARLVSLPSHVPVRVEGNVIIGSKANVQQALQMLPRKANKVRFPANLPKAAVQSVAQKYGLKADNTHLIGDSGSILQALEELNQMPAHQENGFKYHKPQQWYLTQTAQVSLTNLPSSSQEFKDVANRFNETMGQHSRLVSIQRVQNKRLYTNFSYKHEAFSQVEGKALQIMTLFHGTSNTDPAVIYQSDTGLDSRLGKGLWGQGTYYAKNSFYSHDYCYRNSSNQCQMFLCHVLVGDYVNLPQSNSLVRPPQKQNSTSCFHSVMGKTPTSDIWITYEAAMSYPTWLLTYETDLQQQQVMFIPPVLAALLLLDALNAAEDDDD